MREGGRYVKMNVLFSYEISPFFSRGLEMNLRHVFKFLAGNDHCRGKLAKFFFFLCLLS